MKTMTQKNLQPMVLKAALFCSAVAAYAAADSVSLADQQKSWMDRLTEINNSVIGFSINGQAKAGVHSTSLTSDQLDDGAPSRETNSFTEADFNFIARPSVDSRAKIGLRFHQDWQKGYEQGVNSLLIHWWSYDGRILDKKLEFNLGDMKVGYTPLTMYTPQVNFLQEPEIFLQRRLETMDYRNLDTSSKRLMQGLNADFHSGAVSIFDDVHAQGTLSRLRNNPKKNDQVYFDFDYADRYLMGGRLGASSMGADLGVNFIYITDRVKSAHTTDLSISDSVYLEDNRVISLEAGFSSEKVMPSNLTFGIHGEFAMSNWKLAQEYLVNDSVYTYTIEQKPYVRDGGIIDTSLYVVYSGTEVSNNKLTHESMADLDGKALAIRPDVDWKVADFRIKLNGLYLQTDADFQSELAMAPAYMSNTAILNSDAFFNTGLDNSLLSQYRSGNLENLYFSIYQSQTLNQQTLIGKALVLYEDIPVSTYSRLYNNFKMAHFYRNGYNNGIPKRSELYAAAQELDPSVNMALPFGEATPDRKGFGLDLTTEYGEGVTFQAKYGQYQASEYTEINYSTMAAGVGLQLDRLMSLGRVLDVQASFEKSSADAGTEATTTRMMGGVKVGVYKGLSFLAGYQALEKDFGAPIVIENVKESLLLAGPELRIAAGSTLRIQGGLLTNEVQYTDGTASSTLSIDKTLVTADLSVLF